MPDERIVGAISSAEGIIHTFNSWKERAENKGINRKQFFIDQLKKQLTALADQLKIELDGVPIVISGMVSSSIGMQEIPYAQLPFAVDGNGAKTVTVDATDEFPNQVTLISGATNGEDVIRGEETQIIGIVKLLNLQQQEAILILPGTHSKHLYIRQGELIDIQTYMTGEVFSLLNTHSILKDSVSIGNVTQLSTEDADAFKLGVSKSISANILNDLFTVRTNQLFNKLNKEQNFFYLSGLLIGAELKHLGKKDNLPLILCSGNSLYKLYQMALAELDLKQSVTVSADNIDQATIAGQIIVFEKNNITNNNN